MSFSPKIFLYALIALGFLAACSSDEGGNETPTVSKTANLQGTGDSARDILSNEDFDRLHIQIAHTVNTKPTATTINNFSAFLRKHTFKSNIDIEYLQITPPSSDALALSDITDLEKEHRTAYNNGKTLAIYIYFANAPSEDDDEDEGTFTLGAVYRNTSMVIYQNTLQKFDAASASLSITDLETATLNHEFGHLLGLVDLGTPEVEPHEDDEAENHCNVAGCLMRAELRFGNAMAKMLTSRMGKGKPVIPELDAACQADLRANGGR
jgi:hypothetical protein